MSAVPPAASPGTGPDPVEQLRSALDQAAAQLDSIRAALHMGFRGAYWFGALADAVRLAWDDEVGPSVGAAADRLRALADAMREEHG